LWLSNVKSELANLSFKFSARAELREVGGRNFDSFSGLRVAASASFALGFYESAETNEFALIAFFHALLDRVERSIEHLLGLCFSDTAFRGDLLNEFRFIHYFPHMEIKLLSLAVNIEAKDHEARQRKIRKYSVERGISNAQANSGSILHQFKSSLTGEPSDFSLTLEDSCSLKGEFSGTRYFSSAHAPKSSV
jgi:hypothetical protein